ncbi:MAG TPA: c-type cytochrome [Thermoanaerobaculia bacterium]|nr:c-type cytochrome [Thermoanaerobaculia bacterium]
MSRRRAFVLATALAALAAPAARPGRAQNAAPPGGALYQKLCSQCHGEKGDGSGVGAPRLMPRPRDFTAGKFKVRHTPSGSLPTDEDLEHVIRVGMPYTSMPAWNQLSDAQIAELVSAVKSFSPDFASPEKKPKPISIPKAPAFSEESAKKGKEVYARIGCPACHGELGRGDGTSAPTLKDDWSHPIRPADLTKRWTFRGGPSREDIYRTFTTGMNGTPMPSFAESLSDQERWQLVDYIASLDPRDDPGYSELVQVAWTADEIALERGKELFASAPPAYFPVIGQITEPGRAFHPSANGVTVRAVYNARDIAFLVTWHDMRADVSGHNAPDLAIPPDEDQKEGAEAPAPAGGEGIFGEEEAPATAAAPAGGDVWGEDSAEAPGAAGAASTPDTEFSDAVAIQLPAQLPTGIRKPYFIFGDGQNPVDIWFVDLAKKVAQRYNGAGSASLSVVEGEDVSAVASYDHGEWSVIFKRALRATGGVSFVEDQYVPIAFSLWDGAQRERGNKRGLTRWMYLYTMPRETPSTVWPMLRAALAVLAVEILLIWWVRRRRSTPSQDREVQVHV